MSATEIATEAPVVPDPPNPLDRLGGPSLDLALNAPASQQAMIAELLLQLRVRCGSLARAERGYVTTSPAAWRRLRDVSPAELVDACRRTERSFPTFAPPGTDVQRIHTRIGHLLLRLDAAD